MIGDKNDSAPPAESLRSSDEKEMKGLHSLVHRVCEALALRQNCQRIAQEIVIGFNNASADAWIG
jgi:hypothetical protein